MYSSGKREQIREKPPRSSEPLIGPVYSADGRLLKANPAGKDSAPRLAEKAPRAIEPVHDSVYDLVYDVPETGTTGTVDYRRFFFWMSLLIGLLVGFVLVVTNL